MARDLEVLDEQVEKLKNALKALGSFARTPQERLDSALSYFLGTFRSAPEGDAHEHYRAIYMAIGDPPVGTTFDIRLEKLAPQDLEAVSRAMVELCEVMIRRYADAQRHALAEPASSEQQAIPEGTLESLVPGRAWST